MPKSKLDFWRPKLEGNRLRDVRILKELEARGWSVIEVWECQSGANELEALAERVKRMPKRGTPQKRRGRSK